MLIFDSQSRGGDPFGFGYKNTPITPTETIPKRASKGATSSLKVQSRSKCSKQKKKLTKQNQAFLKSLNLKIKNR